MLPAGDDPDNYIQRHGAAAYQEQLRNSRQYLEYLLDRSAADEDLSTDEGRRSFLGKMLTVAARIPDAAQRDQFADRLSHKARITEEVVRAEIRKAAVQRQTNVEEVERRVPAVGQVKDAERGLIWALMHQSEGAREALLELEDTDLEGLATREILRQARSLQEWPAAALPDALIERLTKGEAALVQEIARQTGAPGERRQIASGRSRCGGSTASAAAGAARNRPAAGSGRRRPRTRNRRALGAQDRPATAAR